MRDARSQPRRLPRHVRDCRGIGTLSFGMAETASSRPESTAELASSGADGVTHSVRCRWTLTGFNTSKQLWSPYFTVAGSDGREHDGRVLIYPSGDSQALPGYVSVYLQLSDPGNSSKWDVFASYRLSIGTEAQKGREVLSRDSWHRFSARKKSHGWCDFAPHAALTEPGAAAGSLPESVELSLDITILAESTSFSRDPDLSGRVPGASDPCMAGKFLWTVQNFTAFQPLLKTQKIMSPAFTAGDIMLRLSVYVSALGDGEWLSLCLESKDGEVKLQPERSTWCLFRLSVNAQPGASAGAGADAGSPPLRSVQRDSYGRLAADVRGGENTSLGWNDFMALADFAAPPYLVGDTAVFAASFQVIRETTSLTRTLEPRGGWGGGVPGGGGPGRAGGNPGSLRGAGGGGLAAPRKLAARESDYAARFTWRIDNFTRLKDVLKRRKIQGLCIKSRRFTVGGRDCRLIVYPRGQAQPPTCLSLFLEVWDPAPASLDWTSFVSHRLAVVNQRAEERSVAKESQNRYSCTAKDWGWRDFVSLTTLFDADAGFLVNDAVVFTADAVVLKEACDVRSVLLGPADRAPPRLPGAGGGAGPGKGALGDGKAGGGGSDEGGESEHAPDAAPPAGPAAATPGPDAAATATAAGQAWPPAALRAAAPPLTGDDGACPVRTLMTWRVDNLAAFKDILETRKIFSRFFPVGPIQLRIGLYDSLESLCIYLEGDLAAPSPFSAPGGGGGGGGGGAAPPDPPANHWVRYRLSVVNQRAPEATEWREASLCTRSWNNGVLQFPRLGSLLDATAGPAHRDALVVSCEVLEVVPWPDFRDSGASPGLRHGLAGPVAGGLGAGGQAPHHHGHHHGQGHKVAGGGSQLRAQGAGRGARGARGAAAGGPCCGDGCAHDGARDDDDLLSSSTGEGLEGDEDEYDDEYDDEGSEEEEDDEEDDSDIESSDVLATWLHSAGVELMGSEAHPPLLAGAEAVQGALAGMLSSQPGAVPMFVASLRMFMDSLPRVRRLVVPSLCAGGRAAVKDGQAAVKDGREAGDDGQAPQNGGDPSPPGYAPGPSLMTVFAGVPVLRAPLQAMLLDVMLDHCLTARMAEAAEGGAARGDAGDGAAPAALPPAPRLAAQGGGSVRGLSTGLPPRGGGAAQDRPEDDGGERGAAGGVDVAAEHPAADATAPAITAPVADACAPMGARPHERRGEPGAAAPAPRSEVEQVVALVLEWLRDADLSPPPAPPGAQAGGGKGAAKRAASAAAAAAAAAAAFAPARPAHHPLSSLHKVSMLLADAPPSLLVDLLALVPKLIEPSEHDAAVGALLTFLAEAGRQTPDLDRGLWLPVLTTCSALCVSTGAAFVVVQGILQAVPFLAEHELAPAAGLVRRITANAPSAGPAGAALLRTLMDLHGAAPSYVARWARFARAAGLAGRYVADSAAALAKEAAATRDAPGHPARPEVGAAELGMLLDGLAHGHPLFAGSGLDDAAAGGDGAAAADAQAARPETSAAPPARSPPGKPGAGRAQAAQPTPPAPAAVSSPERPRDVAEDAARAVEAGLAAGLISSEALGRAVHLRAAAAMEAAECGDGLGARASCDAAGHDRAPAGRASPPAPAGLLPLPACLADVETLPALASRLLRSRDCGTCRAAGADLFRDLFLAHDALPARVGLLRRLLRVAVDREGEREEESGATEGGVSGLEAGEGREASGAAPPAPSHPPPPSPGDLLLGLIRSSAALVQPMLVVALQSATELARERARLTRALEAERAARRGEGEAAAAQIAALEESAARGEARAAEAVARGEALRAEAAAASRAHEAARKDAAAAAAAAARQLDWAQDEGRRALAKKAREAQEAAAHAADLESVLTRLRTQRKEESKRATRERAAADAKLKEAEEAAARAEAAAAASASELAREKLAAAEAVAAATASVAEAQRQRAEAAELAAGRAAELEALRAEVAALKSAAAAAAAAAQQREAAVQAQQREAAAAAAAAAAAQSASAAQAQQSHSVHSSPRNRGTAQDQVGASPAPSSWASAGPDLLGMARAGDAGLRAYLPAASAAQRSMLGTLGGPGDYGARGERQGPSPGLGASTPPASPHLKLGGGGAGPAGPPGTQHQAPTQQRVMNSPWSTRAPGNGLAAGQLLRSQQARAAAAAAAAEYAGSPGGQMDAASMLDLLPRDLLHS
ncbi:hypothetical protein ACKKBG_A14285 [Auxenochlorella protothecoides x Auxenochlorella symbiontica]